MGGRKALPEVRNIQFVAGFDHVEVGRTVAYKVGDIVRDAPDALIAAAGDRAVSYSDPEPSESSVTDPPATDGE